MIKLNKPTLFDLFTKEILNRDSILDMSKDVSLKKIGKNKFLLLLGLTKEELKLSSNSSYYLKFKIEISKTTKLGEFINKYFQPDYKFTPSPLSYKQDNIDYEEFTNLLQPKLLFELNRLSHELLKQTDYSYRIIDYGTFSNDIKFRFLKENNNLPEYYYDDVVGFIKDDLITYLKKEEFYSIPYFVYLEDDSFYKHLCLNKEEIESLSVSSKMMYYTILSQNSEDNNRSYSNIYSLIFNSLLNKNLVMTAKYSRYIDVKTVSDFFTENDYLLSNDVALYINEKYDIFSSSTYNILDDLNFDNIIIDDYSIIKYFLSSDLHMKKFKTFYCTQETVNLITDLIYSFNQLSYEIDEIYILNYILERSKIIKSESVQATGFNMALIQL